MSETTAEPFKALGAGNGFTFCRKKRPASANDRPTTVTTLKESMAWYWLLKDFSLEVTMSSINPPGYGIDYNGTLTVQFSDFFKPEDEQDPSAVRAAIGELFNGQPKDRAALNTLQSTELGDGRLNTFALSNHDDDEAGTWITTGNINTGAGQYEVDFNVVWFDDDSCSIVLSISAAYHRFILTNLPTTSSTLTGFSQTPISLGVVTTPYGILTGYDLSDKNTNYGGANTYSVDDYTFTSEFYTFS